MAQDQVSTFTPYVQASFRLTPETHDVIRKIAESKGISQSEVMREATTLLSHTVSLPPTHKLATVDVTATNGPGFYLVKEWIVS